MKRNDVVALAVVGAGVMLYLYRQKASPVPVAPSAVDYINPASPDFVVNQAFRTVGIDLHGLGKKLGAGLYDLIH